jgi:hypothetical protein
MAKKRKQLTTEEKKALLLASAEKALEDGLELRQKALGSRKEGYCCLIGSLSLDRGQEDSGYGIADEVLSTPFRIGVAQVFDWGFPSPRGDYMQDPEKRAEYLAGYEVGHELVLHFKGRILPPKSAGVK